MSESAGQRWTRNKPTEDGWYWWRKPEDNLLIPYVVKVQKSPSGDMFVFWQHDWNYATVLGGEWQGPLTPNEAT